MELVYTVTKAYRSCRTDRYFREEVPLVAVSSRNALALCTTADLREDLSDSELAERSIVETVYQVYVCDIDKPWSVHPLMKTCERVVSLEWHSSGVKLLVATFQGTCYVYQMKDYLLNSWVDPPCVAHIKGEEIAVASWLNQGNQMTFCADKRDSPLYSEKLLKSRSAPSLTQFGGRPVEGLLAITSTGMAVVTLPHSDLMQSNGSGPGISGSGPAGGSGGGGDVSIHMETLCAARTRVRVADVAFTRDGDILAATSDGSVSSAVQCYRVSLRRDDAHGACVISCRSATGLYARAHLDTALRESTSARITHVKYMQRDAGGDVLIVGAGDVTRSSVELWNLINQPIGIHRLYQGGGSGAAGGVWAGAGGGGGVTGHYVQKWVHHSTISCNSLPMSIAVPCFPVSYGHGGGDAAQSSPATQEGALFQYIAVAYKDGSVKLVDKQSFLPMATTNLDTGISDLDNPDKRRKTVAYMTHMQQSFTGCVLVGIDQYSCVYVMKVVNTRDPVTQVPAVYLVGMLEYLLCAGADWWDCLAAIKPEMQESVLTRLSEDFSRQPALVQDQVYCGLMAQKVSLCRAGAAGQVRAADGHCRILLHSIASYFKSLLRPKVFSASETSPSDRLSLSCGASPDLDIDAVVVTLSPEKRFVVEEMTLQSMQPLTQWVADLALHLVASLSRLHSAAAVGRGSTAAVLFPGATLVRDARALGTLRELLVIVRTWGLISTGCLPRFTTLAPGIDCLAQLFRHITKLWLAARGDGVAIDDALIDDCCALTSQMVLPFVDDGLFGDTKYSLALFAQNFPVKYVFGERPSHGYSPRGSSVFPLLPGQSLAPHCKDVVRQISLGRAPSEPTRVCLRCGCRSLAGSVCKLAALRTWEMRYERGCVCGGQWRLDTSVGLT